MELCGGIFLKTMQSNLEKLLQEVIQKILTFVPRKDLCEVVLTSTFLRKLASEPKMWSETKVSKYKIQEDGLPQLFSINRFKKVWRIDLSYLTFTTQKWRMNLDAITSSKVKELNLENANIGEIPSRLLARVASNLERINLNEAHLNKNQSLALMRICISSSTLIDVSLKNAYLRHVPPEVLARAVGNLHKVNLAVYTEIIEGIPRSTTEQYLAVVKVCISSSKLNDVNFLGANLRDIPAELLGWAVGNLNKVNLGGRSLSIEQYNAVLQACVSSSSLMDVSLIAHYLEDVPAEILSKGVANLQKVDLGWTDMTYEQYIQVLEVCISSSTLIDLNLRCANLAEVPVGLLARAASNLQTLDLSRCQLSTDHCIAVLEATHFSSTLVNVSLRSNNLGDVPAELMAQAASQFKTLNLYSTNVTTEQCIALLEASVSSTKLVKMTLCLKKVDTSKIPADLLTQARKSNRVLSRRHSLLWSSY